MGARRFVSLVVVSLCLSVGVLAEGAVGAGAVVRQFGSEGEGAGQFRGVGSVAIDQTTGDVYLFDRGNLRVDKFSAEGSFLLAWGWGVADGSSQEPQTCTTTCYQASGRGPAAGEFDGQELGVAVDDDPLSVSYEDVYVLDQGNSRVDKFSPSGVFLGTFGKEVNEDGANLCLAGEKCQAGKGGKGDYEFESARGAITVDSSGDVFVGDYERVQEFSSEGVFLAAFAVGAEYPASLAVDSVGDFYVVGRSEFGGVPSVLLEYGPSGTFLRTLDTEGEPRAVTIDSAGKLFVGNDTNMLEYGSGGELLASFDKEDSREDGRGGLAFGETIGRLYAPAPQAVRLLAPPPPGPLVESESVSGVEPQDATLEATINPENNATSYRFEYGLTSAYGSTVPLPEGSLPADFNYESVSVTITRLTPNTTYHYRVVATDAKGHTATGADATFTTPTAVSIDNEYATNVASTSATIGGELNPLGAEATYRIEYDTSAYAQGDSPHGTILAEGSLGSGSVDVPVSAHVNNLQPDILYHYRIVASDTREGVQYTIYGPDHTFFTQVAKSTFTLPDGRQWEQVSPVDKQGAALEAPLAKGAAIQASTSGDAISYIANASIEVEPSGNRNPEYAQLFSVRGDAGWTTKDIDTPNNPNAIGKWAFGGSAEYLLFSPDLSMGVLEPRTNTPLPPLSAGAERTIYIRDNRSGEYEPLVTAANVVAGAKFGGENEATSVNFLAATPDMRHVIIESSARLTSDALENMEYRSLYEWADGKLKLVSVLPDGEPASQQESATLGDSDLGLRHTISNDGSRVVWQGSKGSKSLYLRDMVRNETIQVDAAQGVKGKESELSGARFQTADDNGSRVFFTSPARLTAESTASSETPDLYVFEVTSGSGEPLAGSLKDLSVDRNFGENAAVQGVMGASQDGTSIFFAAKGLLGDAGGHEMPDSTYMYAERYSASTKAWSEPHLIASLASGDAPSWDSGALTTMTSSVSADGRFLAFMSSRSLTGYDNRDANSGVPDEEVFLYDADTSGISCVSCNPTGSRPVGILDNPSSAGLTVDRGETWRQSWLAALIPGWTSYNTRAIRQPRYLSDTGRLFFESSDALVPTDTNGTWDVYEFEPVGIGGCPVDSPSYAANSGGCVALISSGGSGKESAFLDASETGNDVFFLTTADLVPQDGDGLYDVYDARVCSATSPCVPAGPVAPPSCSTSDSCKAAPTPQPESFGAPASQTFSGVGNTVVGVKFVGSKSLTRSQKLSRALRACARKKTRGKRATCERQARRRFGQNARARRSKTNKSLPVRAGR
jgi:hypothetical protein